MAKTYKVYAYRDYARGGEAVFTASEAEAKKVANEMIAGKRGYLPISVTITASEDMELLYSLRTVLINNAWSKWEKIA